MKTEERSGLQQHWLCRQTKGPVSQGLEVASQLETRGSCSSEPQKGVQPCHHLDFSLPEIKISSVHTSEPLCEIIKTDTVWAPPSQWQFFYGSCRELTHHGWSHQVILSPILRKMSSRLSLHSRSPIYQMGPLVSEPHLQSGSIVPWSCTPRASISAIQYCGILSIYGFLSW